MPYDTITSLSQRIRDGQVSPVDIVDACLKRIELLNPSLNAFITLNHDALEQARSAQAEILAGHWRGPMHGVPVAVKDFYDTAGTRTTGGFEQMKDRTPARDADVVAKLKLAGGIVVGKTNMDALGMATTGLTSHFGPVRNPWNPDYVTGGSSAGSAAAVASGMCYASVDTDAVGSVRLPAACCGVVGIKGTYGLISLGGVLGDEPVDDFIRWMGHAGVMARTVHDAALVLNAVADLDGKDVASGMAEADSSLRVGVGNNYAAVSEVTEAVDQAVNLLRSCGYQVSPAAVPFGDPGQATMASVERDRARVAGDAFADIDVIALGTLQTLVPTVNDAERNPEEGVSAENTAFANYYGLPAMSIPCGFDSHGMPIGLQLVGKPGGERDLLNVAHHYELRSRAGRPHPIP